MASSINASEAVLCSKQAEGPGDWSARVADPWINPDLFSVLHSLDRVIGEVESPY